MKNSIQLAALIGAVSMFSACSDDVTEVYNSQTGMSVLEKGEKLSKQTCDENNVGEMLYVTDESAAYFCNGEKWETLKGEDGKNGNSCSVKQNKDKSVTTITCETEDGKVSYDVKDGKNGTNGYSCSAKQNKNKTITTITCETEDGKVSYEVKNGEDGNDGNDGNDGDDCRVKDNGDGTVVVVCGDGEGESSAKIFKAMCGKTPYDPENYECVNGIVYGLLEDDREGSIYKTVIIGSQEWMAENLNYSVMGMKDHDRIELSKCGGSRAAEAGDCDIYGRLYTWSVAVDTMEIFSENAAGCGFGTECKIKGNVRGVCPEGWHIPSKSDWETLIEFVGGSEEAGKNLKLEGSSLTSWYKPAQEAPDFKEGSDLYGFGGIGAGSGNGNVGQMGEFWAATQDDDSKEKAYHMYLSFFSDQAVVSTEKKDSYKSVRCVKD